MYRAGDFGKKYANERDGPAIRMEKSDHRKTASCGRFTEAQSYCQKQKKLIEEGKFREAVQILYKMMRNLSIMIAQ